jgi:hypothetical protein
VSFDFDDFDKRIDEILAAGVHPETRMADPMVTVDNDGNVQTPSYGMAQDGVAPQGYLPGESGWFAAFGALVADVTPTPVP